MMSSTNDAQFNIPLSRPSDYSQLMNDCNLHFWGQVKTCHFLVRRRSVCLLWRSGVVERNCTRPSTTNLMTLPMKDKSLNFLFFLSSFFIFFGLSFLLIYRNIRGRTSSLLLTTFCNATHRRHLLELLLGEKKKKKKKRYFLTLWWRNKR